MINCNWTLRIEELKGEGGKQLRLTTVEKLPAVGGWMCGRIYEEDSHRIYLLKVHMEHQVSRNDSFLVQLLIQSQEKILSLGINLSSMFFCNAENQQVSSVKQATMPRSHW